MNTAMNNGTNGSTNGNGVREVLIVGGGPAGSTAANFLAQKGHDVLLLEKEVFPRFHIGESLLPIDLPVFERLGVKLDPARFITKAGAEFIDETTGETKTFLFREGMQGTPPSAYQVERSFFDEVLLRQAEKQGAEVREGVKVQDIVFDEAGGPVRVESSAGTHRARFLIDATGQDAFLARANRTVDPLKGFGRAATFRHFEPLRPEIAAELYETGNIKILMIPDGWIWVIPLAGSRLSVGLVNRGVNSAEQLDKAIADSPLLQRLIAGCHSTEPRIIRNFSYRNRRAYGSRFACAGDASCFLDPVFSSGVSLAILGAESVVEVLSPALREGRETDPDLMKAHADKMSVGYRSFAGFIYRFYNAGLVHKLLFQDTEGEPLRPEITSVLGCDLWRDDNAFQKMLLNSLSPEAWPE
jgi:flavin-dependent dehydrogenase